MSDWSQPIEWDLRLRIVQDMANGILFLQTNDPPIAHIDLKSPNILLSSLDPNEVCAKIADFGTSQVILAPITVSKVENPRWQAPEMISRQPYNQKVDTYAFGVTCWELLVRKTFFYELSFSSDVAEYVTSGERPLIPNELCPSLYRRIIEECWSQNPDKRPEMTHVLDLISQMTSDIVNYQAASREYDKDLFKQYKEAQRLERKEKKVLRTPTPNLEDFNFLFDDQGRIANDIDIGLVKKTTEQCQKPKMSSEDSSDESDPWNTKDENFCLFDDQGCIITETNDVEISLVKSPKFTLAPKKEFQETGTDLDKGIRSRGEKVLLKF
eukprot:TRINITY_DN9941_c0_g2_i3.p1 TRINITY_DN9941_c0_g2~~TRINITY_DN9941_c0_g2_i3.p1  ORF type:complete len:326 (-),score=69.74 TRINITY_DN9941_c0_g2_i3:220-1197(-)